MGYFSWMYADNLKKNLLIGGRAYVPFPSDQGSDNLPAGTILTENNYEGYGVFAGHDIYDLVAEWNRDYLSEENLRKPDRSKWEDSEQGEHYYQAAVKRFEKSLQKLRDFQKRMPDTYMKETYGEWWKRDLGIEIACYDHDNAALKYPIKICQLKKNCNYETLPPSKDDQNQGFL